METKKMVVKALPIIGVILTIAGSLVNSIVSKKNMEETVEKVVNEKLANK